MNGRNLAIGAGGLAALYFLTRPRETGSVPTFTKGGRTYYGSSPSMIGLNAQPSLAGFHPSAEATFSTWALVGGGPTARVIRIAPISESKAGKRQEYIRDNLGGDPYAGIPFTDAYDSRLPVKRLVGADDLAVLTEALSAIYAMESQRTGQSPVVAPLVITTPDPLEGIPPEIAVPEYEWTGDDPR